jgi:amino acid adenylation domain-containing protein
MTGELSLFRDAFAASVEKRPSATALVCGPQRLSYVQLAQRALRLAALMRAAGVAAGDRVLLYLDNSVEFVEALYAVMHIGAVFVPVSPLTKASKLTYLLQDTRAAALLTHSAMQAEWAAALQLYSGLRLCLVAGGTMPGGVQQPWPSDDAAAAPPLAPVDTDDLAALIYTSGTTGVPKGVMLTHRNMRAAWRSVQAYLQLREDDVIGLALPVAFSYGLYHVLMGLGLGATVVLERSAVFPVKLLERWAAERVTVFPGVPTLFSALLGVHDARHDLSALRLLTNAAAPLPEAHVAQLRRAFPQARLFLMYGLTECKRASYLPPEQLDARPGSVGRGMPYQEHWLIDENANRLPHGATGELVVCGEHVMLGYWNKPIETAERLHVDALTGRTVLHTGDLFRSDAEGYLYFVARRDDIIKSRGEKVAPKEVEEVLYRLDGVQDAAVVGVPDAALGQAVKAYVTLRPGARLSEREVIRHCLASMESFMAPRQVEFVDALPRTDSGKIRRASLRSEGS